MSWQSSTIDPSSTTPASDISKIKNDLQQLRTVIGGGTDSDIPVGQPLRQVASITDYMTAAQIADAKSGALTLDCAAAINATLAAAQHVFVPAGYKCLIASTVAVPAGRKLEFAGGLGNTSGQFPSSYFVKKSTMSGPGITVGERGWVYGGGLICQAGNTGDGLQLLNNSATACYFLVHGAGSDGVRVGQNAGANTNSFLLDHVVSQYNGGRGFFVHDGKTGVGADANAGTLRQCFSHHNGVDGFSLGHCFWVLMDNCLAENNGGWGLYLDDTNDGLGYPMCRYATILGGDYNETNALGVIYDRSYRSVFINPDPANIPSNAGGALQGSGQRGIFGTFGSRWYGGTTYTLQGTQPFTVDDGAEASLTYGQVIKKTTTGSNAHGTGVRVDINNGTTTYTGAGGWNVQQLATGKWGTVLLGHNGTSSVQIALADGANNAFRPSADNTFACGLVGARWTTVYAVSGTINTSDAREKQDIRELSEAERAVAVRLKGLVRTYRWREAVAAKGDAARIHCGFIAQDVIAAFEAEGLDAFAYGACCFDRWDDQPGVEAGERYSIRVDQILAFIIAAL